MGLLKKSARHDVIKIFYATDLHGSEVTWRKFLNAARFYEVDALVCGGDLMGKVVVPVVRRPGGRREAELQGKLHVFDDEESVAAFTRRLATLGHYWVEYDEDEYDAVAADESAVEALFVRLARERLRNWVNLAEERLADSHVRCYLSGGNDDTDEVLEVLADECEDRAISCEGAMVSLSADHTMVSLGYSTPTPWNTPREATDDVLAGMIEELMRNVPDPSRCVFNFHVPPLESSLDTCLELDTSVWPPRPVMRAGQPVEYGAGSAAVRDALENYQPLIGLHGHIHESRGNVKYGRAVALNPGSEYGEGILRGAIIAIQDSRVLGTQFTSG